MSEVIFRTGDKVRYRAGRFMSLHEGTYVSQDVNGYHIVQVGQYRKRLLKIEKYQEPED